MYCRPIGCSKEIISRPVYYLVPIWSIYCLQHAIFTSFGNTAVPEMIRYMYVKVIYGLSCSLSVLPTNTHCEMWSPLNVETFHDTHQYRALVEVCTAH